MPTVTFTKVFKAEGNSQRGPWTRWDYKTADETRYPHFADTQEIPLESVVEVEVNAKGSIKSWKAVRGDLTAANQQAGFVPVEGPNGVSGQHTRSQGVSRDFQAEAEGKTRCALVAQLLPAMFTALDAEDQTPEGAQVLLDWAFAYVFQTDQIPF